MGARRADERKQGRARAAGEAETERERAREERVPDTGGALSGSRGARAGRAERARGCEWSRGHLDQRSVRTSPATRAARSERGRASTRPHATHLRPPDKVPAVLRAVLAMARSKAAAQPKEDSDDDVCPSPLPLLLLSTRPRPAHHQTRTRTQTRSKRSSTTGAQCASSSCVPPSLSCALTPTSSRPFHPPHRPHTPLQSNGKVLEYHIKWEGYDERTWEPSDSIECVLFPLPSTASGPK